MTEETAKTRVIKWLETRIAEQQDELAEKIETHDPSTEGPCCRIIDEMVKRINTNKELLEALK